MSDNKQDQTLFQEAMTPPDTVFVMPQIDEDVPIPSKNSHTTPKMTAAEELTVRTHTIKELSDLEGNTLEPSTIKLLSPKYNYKASKVINVILLLLLFSQVA